MGGLLLLVLAIGVGFLIFRWVLPKIASRGYFRKAVAGMFSAHNSELFTSGFRLLAKNFWVFVVAYLMSLPLFTTVWQYANQARIKDFVTEFHKNFSNMSHNSPSRVDINIFYIGNSLFTPVGNILSVLDSIAGELGLAIIAAAFPLAIYYFIRMNFERDRISVGKRLFFIALFALTALVVSGHLYLSIRLQDQFLVTKAHDFDFSGWSFAQTWLVNGFIYLFVNSLLYCALISVVNKKVEGAKLTMYGFFIEISESYQAAISYMILLVLLGLAVSLPMAFVHTIVMLIYEGPYNYLFAAILSLFLTAVIFYVVMPLPVVMIMNRGFIAPCMEKIKQWHISYPDRIGSAILTMWLLTGLGSVIEINLANLYNTPGKFFWAAFLLEQAGRLVVIFISCWMLFCTVKMVKELEAGNISASVPTPMPETRDN